MKDLVKIKCPNCGSEDVKLYDILGEEYTFIYGNYYKAFCYYECLNCSKDFTATIKAKFTDFEVTDYEIR